MYIWFSFIRLNNPSIIEYVTRNHNTRNKTNKLTTIEICMGPRGP